VLLRRGGLNFITYSHTAADIAQAVAAAGEAFGALRDAGFGGGRPPDAQRTESQQVGAAVG
jgi:hypothetical protein